MWTESFLQELQKGTSHVCDLFYKDRDLSALIELFTEEFVEVWDNGFNHYTNGEWE